jgi:hypothetical protein
MEYARTATDKGGAGQARGNQHERQGGIIPLSFPSWERNRRRKRGSGKVFRGDAHRHAPGNKRCGGRSKGVWIPASFFLPRSISPRHPLLRMFLHFFSSFSRVHNHAHSSQTWGGGVQEARGTIQTFATPLHAMHRIPRLPIAPNIRLDEITQTLDTKKKDSQSTRSLSFTQRLRRGGIHKDAYIISQVGLASGRTV